MLAFLYLEFHAVTPLRLEVANDIGHLPSTPTAPSCRIGTQALRIRTATEAAVNELLHDHVRKAAPLLQTEKYGISGCRDSLEPFLFARPVRPPFAFLKPRAVYGGSHKQKSKNRTL